MSKDRVGTAPVSACSLFGLCQEIAMRRPVLPIAAMAVAGIAFLTGIPFPLFAQTGASLLEGAAAFSDWRADRPGIRRLIKPQDLPAPDPAQSASNSVRTVHRTDQKPIVPNGFEVNLFASAWRSADHPHRAEWRCLRGRERRRPHQRSPAAAVCKPRCPRHSRPD